MIAYLIDPLPLADYEAGAQVSPHQLLRQVEHSGEVEDIHQKLQRPGQPVDDFECLRHASFADSLYVEANGLAHNPQFWFTYYKFPRPMTGRGLLCGIDERGDNCAPVTSLQEVRMAVAVGYRNILWSAATGLVRLDTHVLEHWNTYSWLQIPDIIFD